MTTDYKDVLEKQTLDVTVLAPSEKHPTVFKWFDQLRPGESFLLHNDHDPKPLYYQLVAERGKVITWEYQQQGPDVWLVEIGKRKENTAPTIGELVAADIRKGDVFRKYSLDFCCGGKQTLEEACGSSNVDINLVESDLKNLEPTAGGPLLSFNTWNLDFLIDYIYNQHHQYWYQEEPVISDLLDKVTDHHGKTYSWLPEVQQYFRTLKQELAAHFMKEERVLFPYIKKMVVMQQQHSAITPPPFGSVTSPVRMMEMEHDAAGDLLLSIRNSTNGYTAPANACNSTRLLLYKLESLEKDLHQHIHLENNILFPKAIKLEEELLRP